MTDKPQASIDALYGFEAGLEEGRSENDRLKARIEELTAALSTTLGDIHFTQMQLAAGHPLSVLDRRLNVMAGQIEDSLEQGESDE